MFILQYHGWRYLIHVLTVHECTVHTFTLHELQCIMYIRIYCIVLNSLFVVAMKNPYVCILCICVCVYVLCICSLSVSCISILCYIINLTIIYYTFRGLCICHLLAYSVLACMVMSSSLLYRHNMYICIYVYIYIYIYTYMCVLCRMVH